MPLFELSTNNSLKDEQALAGKLSGFTAQLLGKPESYVMIKVRSQQTILFAGSDEPAAHIKLKSLGLPQAQTAAFSASICDFINTECGIDSSRIYIEFSSPERHMWGWDSRTF